MATLDDLGVSISQMEHSEAIDLIKAIRLARRTPPKKARKSKAKAPPKIDTDLLLKTTKKEDLSELIKILEAADD